MKNESQTAKCDERVYPPGRYGSFNAYYCGRPAKYDGKCGIHSKEANEKRRMISEQKYKAKRSAQKENDITNAISLLKSNGYKVTK